MLGESVWQTLARPSRGATGLVAVRLHPESAFNLFAALDQANGHRFLLLKSAQPDHRLAVALPEGRGFSLAAVHTPGDPDGAHCLRFELTDLAHADVFDVIGNDVLRHLLAAKDEATAFLTFVGRIAEWQHFLNTLPRGGLSEHAQLGLFAELWFLRQHLLTEIAPLCAIQAWTGPRALTKDFEFKGLAFEVKATAAKQPAKFQISGELQLDIGGVGRLILYALLVERLAAGGLSLRDLVAAMRENLAARDTAALVVFGELLLQSGYIDADADRYSTQFAFRSEHFFDVRGDFPRIVGADLRPGVGDVRYSVQQSECERYAIGADAVRNLIRATS
ncbi:MAG: PD-(D/E)XK motif protein [Bacteroidales bacterium]